VLYPLPHGSKVSTGHQFSQLAAVEGPEVIILFITTHTSGSYHTSTHIWRLSSGLSECSFNAFALVLLEFYSTGALKESIMVFISLFCCLLNLPMLFYRVSAICTCVKHRLKLNFMKWCSSFATMLFGCQHFMSIWYKIILFKSMW